MENLEKEIRLAHEMLDRGYVPREDSNGNELTVAKRILLLRLENVKLKKRVVVLDERLRQAKA